MKKYINAINLAFVTPVIYMCVWSVSEEWPELFNGADYLYHLLFNDKVENIMLAILASILLFYLIRYHEVRRELNAMIPHTRLQLMYLLGITDESEFVTTLEKLEKAFKDEDEDLLRTHITQFLNKHTDHIKNGTGADIFFEATINESKNQNIIERNKIIERINDRTISRWYSKEYFPTRYGINYSVYLKDGFEKIKDMFGKLISEELLNESNLEKRRDLLKEYQQVKKENIQKMVTFLEKHYLDFIKRELYILKKISETKRTLLKLLLEDVF